MNGSNRPIAAALAGAWLATTAAAQQPNSAPVTLVPAPVAASAPGDLAPGDLAPGDSAPRSIEVGQLPELSIDRIGLTDTVTEMLPDSMWANSDPEFVKSALARLPRKLDSIALRTLALRLLLPPALTPMVPNAGALPPSSETADAEVPAAAPPEDPWLFHARVDALARLGDWTDAVRLINLLPSDKINGALKKTEVDGMIVDGKIDAACTEAQAQLNASPDLHWQKVQVLCQFHTKQDAAAQLGLSLLQEQGIDDPAFFWAAELLQGSRPLTPNGVQKLEPVVLGLLRLAQRAVPDTVLRDGDPTALRFAALMESSSAGTPDEKLTESEKADRARLLQGARVVLAERALALGSLAPDDVAKLYLAVDFSTDVKPPQLTQVAADDPRGRAFMFQLAQAQTVPTARAEVMARAIDLARADRGAKGPSLAVVAQVYSPFITELAPTPDLIWFSGHAVRALTATGAAEAARPWIDLVGQMARTNIEAAEILDSLWPLLHLGGGTTAASSQDLRAWQATQAATGALAQREVLLNLLEAVGDPVTASDWLPVLVGGAKPIDDPHPAVGVWNGLAEAARSARSGDTVTLALIAAGDRGLGQVSPLTLARIIQSLMVAGRALDARALAVEAALAAGL